MTQAGGTRLTLYRLLLLGIMCVWQITHDFFALGQQLKADLDG